jgi:hypothetical protein
MQARIHCNCFPFQAVAHQVIAIPCTILHSSRLMCGHTHTYFLCTRPQAPCSHSLWVQQLVYGPAESSSSNTPTRLNTVQTVTEVHETLRSTLWSADVCLSAHACTVGILPWPWLPVHDAVHAVRTKSGPPTPTPSPPQHTQNNTAFISSYPVFDRAKPCLNACVPVQVHLCNTSSLNASCYMPELAATYQQDGGHRNVLHGFH